MQYHTRCRSSRWIGRAAAPLALLLLIPGCPTSSEGLDLTEDAILTLVISRESGSAVATATARVTTENLLSTTMVRLADDQIISVNSVPLTPVTQTVLSLDASVAATIESVDESDEYTIRFDNQGVETTVDVAPPEDFADVSPDDGDQVSRAGFDLEWAASDNDDATISILITGLVNYYASDGSLQTTAYEVPLNDLADDGGITIGSAELAYFLPGEIDVTLTRTLTVSQKLGFSEGTIRFEIERMIPLELVEDE